MIEKHRQESLKWMEKTMRQICMRWQCVGMMNRSFLQQLADERFHNRIEEALSRCTYENEVFLRKVYIEKRKLVGMSVQEQRKRKKESLRQFFDCFYI